MTIVAMFALAVARVKKMREDDEKNVVVEFEKRKSKKRE